MNTLVPYAKPLYVPPVNAEEYFPLLLRTAGATGQITPEQYASLMRQMAHMLQAAVYRYSMGANSSVPYEKAQSLVLSQLYCLGFGLKQYPNTAQALQAVLHTPLHLLATQGRQQVTAATRSANHLWRATKAAQIQTPNRPYHDTIRGIGQFFRLYDVVYAANETPADIDYPLALPRWELCGVEYMLHYLQAFLLETRFLRYFKPGLVHAVLLRAQPTYATLPLNLCAPVLLCALGCLLSGASIQQLAPNSLRLQTAAAQYSGQPTALQAKLEDMLPILYKQLSLQDACLQKYLAQTLRGHYPVMHAALQHGNLAHFFLANPAPV